MISVCGVFRRRDDVGGASVGLGLNLVSKSVDFRVCVCCCGNTHSPLQTACYKEIVLKLV